ncbi:hypothetical protein SCHPADRAFT_901495 [Schizopora paradoxa]|uniref:Secreted protein n=1 Tax=Schizopora paradoxa TaxID=27342 RepID=A0A0H2RXU4_9AGAM|nr:hypothetical protein SCHPADRAFT_901495 [Schizopora paradoxa]
MCLFSTLFLFLLSFLFLVLLDDESIPPCPRIPAAVRHATLIFCTVPNSSIGSTRVRVTRHILFSYVSNGGGSGKGERTEPKNDAFCYLDSHFYPFILNPTFGPSELIS